MQNHRALAGGGTGAQGPPQLSGLVKVRPRAPPPPQKNPPLSLCLLRLWPLPPSPLVPRALVIAWHRNIPTETEPPLSRSSIPSSGIYQRTCAISKGAKTIGHCCAALTPRILERREMHFNIYDLLFIGEGGAGKVRSL